LVAKRLAKLGVTVLDGPGAKVTAVTRDAVQLGDGRSLPSMVTIWTAGFGVPDLATNSGLSTDAVGRLLTDETLTSVDDAHIVAAGDSAAPSDLPLRMSCQAAGPLGAHAADTVLSRIAGEQPTPIKVGFFGQCISLGHRAAVVQLASKDDTATRFYIGGRLAATIKKRSFTGLVKVFADEAHRPGSYKWLFRDDKRRKLLQARRNDMLSTR
jgi:NADH dehydrogenase FAD-containing subunit